MKPEVKIKAFGEFANSLLYVLILETIEFITLKKLTMFAQRYQQTSDKLQIDNLSFVQKELLKKLYLEFSTGYFTEEAAKARVKGYNKKYVESMWEKGFIITDKNGMTINPKIDLIDDEALSLDLD